MAPQHRAGDRDCGCAVTPSAATGSVWLSQCQASFAMKTPDISVTGNEKLLKPQADAVFGNTGQGAAELGLNATLVYKKLGKPLHQPVNGSFVGRPEAAIGLPSEALDQLD
jgi:hypothetical protein